MHVTPFRLLGAASLDAVRAAAASAVAAWSAQWGLDPAPAAVGCERADAGLAGVAWDQCWSAGGRELWLACPDGLPMAMQQAMFGADASHVGRIPAPPQLAPAAAARALDALVSGLAAALLGQGAQQGVARQPAARELGRGAGTLVLTVRVGAASLRCLLGSDAVARLAPSPPAPRAPLAPVDLFKALQATPVRLAVRLGQAEVGLGALMSVAVGDVIRLDCAADATVDVLGPQGDALFRAYPGQTQGAVAVEIDSRH